MATIIKDAKVTRINRLGFKKVRAISHWRDRASNKGQRSRQKEGNGGDFQPCPA